MAKRLPSTAKTMRDRYFDELLPIFRQDPKTILVSADDGGPSVWPITDVPGQFINVGIAEEQMIGMATGLAHEGWNPWVYAIDNFVTVRALEFVKMACVMNARIKFLGSGAAGCSYDIMGPTHIAIGVISTMRQWPNLKIYSPADGVTAAALARISYEDRSPQYIRFDRHNPSDLYRDTENFRDGLQLLSEGHDCLIAATGVMVHHALTVSELLKKKGISAGVVDLFRLKPLNWTKLATLLSKTPHLVTLEEDYLEGGIGSSILELLNDRGMVMPVLRLGMPQVFVFDLGGREAIWESYGLDAKTIEKRIIKWLHKSQAIAY